MTLPTLTDWLSVATRPVRVGWYQMRYLIRHSGAYSGPVLRYWTGRRWAEDASDRQRAIVTDDDQWRGCADRPPPSRLTDPRKTP